MVADYLKQRVWLWDGVEQARCWHLLVRREIGGTKLKFCLANAKLEASLRQLAEMAARHFVERAFEDAKGACGMADAIKSEAGGGPSHGAGHGRSCSALKASGQP